MTMVKQKTPGLALERGGTTKKSIKKFRKETQDKNAKFHPQVETACDSKTQQRTPAISKIFSSISSYMKLTGGKSTEFKEILLLAVETGDTHQSTFRKFALFLQKLFRKKCSSLICRKFYEKKRKFRFTRLTDIRIRIKMARHLKTKGRQ